VGILLVHLIVSLVQVHFDEPIHLILSLVLVHRYMCDIWEFYSSAD
jgi:hypothetical protein